MKGDLKFKLNKAVLVYKINLVMNDEPYLEEIWFRMPIHTRVRYIDDNF